MKLFSHPGPSRHGSFNHAIAEFALDTPGEWTQGNLSRPLRRTVRPDPSRARDPKGAPFHPRSHSTARKSQRPTASYCASQLVGPAARHLKGWIDRVFRPGVAYEFWRRFGRRGAQRSAEGKDGPCVQHLQHPRSREIRVFGDPLETLWKNCIFGLCGVKNVRRRMFGVIVTSTASNAMHG